jgi:hypothetical protein
MSDEPTIGLTNTFSSTITEDPPRIAMPIQPPARFVYVNPQGFVQSDSEGRMIGTLRDTARAKDPLQALAWATCSLLDSKPDPELAQAQADLAVTGRTAYTRFCSAPPSEATLLPRVTTALAQLKITASTSAMTAAIGTVLDRAYDVAWALRGPGQYRVAARPALGWIAVSGEDDPPHVPVNWLPSNDVYYEQHQMAVTVPTPAEGAAAASKTVSVRFTIAPSPGNWQDGPSRSQRRSIPPELTPFVPPDDRVILFIHGAGSNCEESLFLTKAVHEVAHERRARFTVLAVDLPCSGYSEMFPHVEVAPTAASSYQGAATIGNGGVAKPIGIGAPILDFLETFLVQFVDSLDQVTPIKSHFAGAVGGSLGGNLGLRLGRHDRGDAPWLAAGIVSWSPASVWPPLIEDAAKSDGPKACFDDADAAENDDYYSAVLGDVANTSSRVHAFRYTYFKSHLPGTIPIIADTWYSNAWPAKQDAITASRLGAHENYNEWGRRWGSRLDGEQLIYSHVDVIDRTQPGGPNNPLRCSRNWARELLLAGADDQNGKNGTPGVAPYTNIFQGSCDIANRMTVPGRAMFLATTGHSIHFERPRFLAAEIVRFFDHEGYAAVSADGRELALFRLWNPTNGDHFYTISKDEAESATGYAYEGLACAVLAPDSTDGVPIYRGFDGAYHVYSTEANEVATTGYNSEGVRFRAPNPSASTLPFYRFSSQYNRDRLYSTDKDAPNGYSRDGVTCQVFPAGGTWTVPPLLAEEPCAASVIAGTPRARVLCRGKDSLLYSCATDDGQTWSWAPGGGPFLSALKVTSPASGASVVALSDHGRPVFEAVCRSSEGHLRTAAWNGSAFAWSDAFAPYGDAPGAPALGGVPALAAYAPTPLFAFAVDVAGALFVARSDGSAWKWSERGAPPGSILQPLSSISAVAYLEGNQPRVYAFGVSVDGHLRVCYGDGASWTWADQGAPASTRAIAPPTAITMVKNGVAWIYVFVHGADGHLHVSYWDGAAWHWADQGAPDGVTTLKGRIGAFASRATGRIYVAVRGGDTSAPRLYVNLWNGSQWTWRDLGAPPGTTVAGGVSTIGFDTAPALLSPPPAVERRARPDDVLHFVVGADGIFYINRGDGDTAAWIAKGGA